jgi:septin family protein
MNQGCDYNVLLLGLQGAGKTHLLYNSIFDENFFEAYRDNNENVKRADKAGISSKSIALMKTVGYNCEFIQEK